MREKKFKKMVVRLHNQEVIDLVEGLPKGYRSVVIESALQSFLRTDLGRELIETLTCRNGNKGERGVPLLNGGNVFKRLEGDF